MAATYSTSLIQGFGGNSQWQAFLAYANGSPLLGSMLAEFSGSITTTPAGQSGTYSDPKTNTIYLDPSWLPMTGHLTPIQLAQTIAHELGHLLLTGGSTSVTSGETPDQALSIGRTNEGDAVTAEFIVGEQLGGSSAVNSQLASILRSDAGKDLSGTGVAAITSTAALENSGQFFVDAVKHGGTQYEGFQPSRVADAKFHYHNYWLDSWVLDRMYGVDAGEFDMQQMHTGSLIATPDNAGNWTFTGKNIPLLAGAVVPYPLRTFYTPGTLSFQHASFSHDGTINLGDITLVGDNRATILGGGSVPNDLLQGVAGTQYDDFQIVLPQNIEVPNTIIIDPKGVSSGRVSVAGIALDSSADTPLMAEENIGPLYQWSANGAAGGFQYTYSATLHTLTISNGDPGGIGSNVIVIKNFDLAAAESSSGFLGIYLQRNVALEADASLLQEGLARTLTLSLNFTASANQVVRFSIDPSYSGDFDIVTGAQELSFVDGAVDIPLAAGQSTFMYSLVSIGDVDQDAQIDLSAVLVDSNGNALGTASTLSIDVQASEEISAGNADTIYTLDSSQGNGGSAVGLYTNIYGGAPGASYFRSWTTLEDPSTPAAHSTEVIDMSLSLPQSGHDLVTADAGLGDSYIIGSAYRDAIQDGINVAQYPISFGDDSDVLVGGSGDDVLQTHGGNDESHGGDGNDLIVDTPIDHVGQSFGERTWLDALGHLALAA